MFRLLFLSPVNSASGDSNRGPQICTDLRKFYFFYFVLDFFLFLYYSVFTRLSVKESHLTAGI